MVVDTIELYEQLQNGEIEAFYKKVIVTADAHPHVLQQPIHFENSSFWSIQFRDTKNEIIIHPANQIRRVNAYFFEEEQILSGLPTSYEYYTIFFFGSAISSTENIKAVLKWKNAHALNIGDLNDIAYELTNSNELSEFKQLYRLELTLQQPSYKKIKVQNVIDNLPSLKYFLLSGRALLSSQITEFVLDQTLPPYWSVRLLWPYFIQYERYIN